MFASSGDTDHHAGRTDATDATDATDRHEGRSVDAHAVEMRIESFLDNFRKNYAEWESNSDHLDRSINTARASTGSDCKTGTRNGDPLTESDSGTSLCTVHSLSSIPEARESSSSNFPNSDSASSSLSMKSNATSLSATTTGSGSVSGSGTGSRCGTPKNLGKFRQFYKSAFLALSQTSDFDRGK